MTTQKGKSTKATPKATSKAKPKAASKTKAAAAKKPAAKRAAPKTAPRNTAASRAKMRPWIKSYPEGITWDTKLDLTPVHERVRNAAQTHPQNIALDFLGNRINFADMWRETEALAGALQKQLGIKKGTRVALLLPNTPYYVYAYYAVLLAGGTVVNCNPLYTVNELDHIIANSGADIMITLDLGVIFEKAEKLCAEGPINTLVVCPFVGALPMVKSLLFRIAKRSDLADIGGSRVADRVVHYADLVKSGHKADPVEIANDDVAVQQYTGGTTGVPKGAMLTHANIAANVSQIDAWGCGLFEPPTFVLAVLPFFHIFAMTVCMNTPLSNGAGVVMLPRFDLKTFLDTVKRTEANVLPAVPTLTHAIANAKATKPEMIDSLEVLISGGAALPNETRGAFAKVSNALLAEGYGLTECSPVVCCAALRTASKEMSIGQPIPGTDIRFADIEDPAKEVALGERGELQVKGLQVMLGYYENAEATKEAFVDGWFRTGDVGYVDEDGYVFLVDRIKDLIICSGFNVYPRNIEEALYKHPAVDECNVIGVNDEYRGEAPVAFVKLNEGKSATAAELKTFLAEHISKIELPRDIIFKDELPKTLVGKLSKNELRDEYAKLKEQNSEQV